jgi:hypothetical protein
MAKTAGTWVHAGAPSIGAQPIAAVSTTQNHPFGTILPAKDIGATAYGQGEFVYVKGVASGAVNAWTAYRSKSGKTTLAVASGDYAEGVGVMMATLDATTKFGWLQIKGRAIGSCLTGYADNAKVFLTSTAGSIAATSVTGDLITGARGRNGGTVTVGDLAGEFELNRPFCPRQTALAT